MIEHPPPTAATVKALYGTATHCAMTGCGEALYVAGDDGVPLLNSRVAHICARSEGGPRWDPDMGADENRSEANLVLMCIKHAAHIDGPEGERRYSPSDLLRMKAEHREQASGAGIRLTDTQADEVVRMSFGGDTNVNADVLVLGGQGGSAPGAGGGGGGALGPGAKGGEGGQGGEMITEWFPADELPESVPIRVGRGGRGGLWGDGEDGEDSSFGPLVARGGLAGRAGHATGVDTMGDAAVRISAAVLADAISIRGGLMTIAHGGWSRYRVTSLPEECRWALGLIVDIEADGRAGSAILDVAVYGPQDPDPITDDTLTVDVPESDGFARVPIACGLRARVELSGVHHIAISRSGDELARLPLQVHHAAADEASAST